MKRILGLSIALVALLILVGCEGEVTLVAPDVTYVVSTSNHGGTLVLSWTEVTDADGYYIYRDGVLVDTIDDATTTTYSATIPAQLYEVSAFAGEDESATDQIDCEPVVTNLTIYALSDPDTLHPSGLSFNANGSAVGMSVVAANYDDLDYIFDDVNFTSLTLASPNAYTPEYNSEKNMSVDTDSTDFDAIVIANAPGVYSTQTQLAGNTVFAFFMDQDDDNWDTDSDYFGKIYVESIVGTAITINVAYQPITGLRWCVTD
jgi:hypothetical protein